MHSWPFSLYSISKRDASKREREGGGGERKLSITQTLIHIPRTNRAYRKVIGQYVCVFVCEQNLKVVKFSIAGRYMQERK